MEDGASRDMKLKLKRIVSMLTRMAMKFDGVEESSVEHAVVIDYEYVHRDAEHKHERKPEPGRLGLHHCGPLPHHRTCGSASGG